MTPIILIAVKTLDERQLTMLRAKPGDTFKTVKEQLEKDNDIPCEQQQLYSLDGISLDDEAIIGDANVNEIELRRPGEMAVFVNTFYGKAFLLLINADSTIEEVRKKIAERESLPLCVFRLDYKDTELDKERTVSSNDIKHRETFDLLKNASTCSCPSKHSTIKSIDVRTNDDTILTLNVETSESIKLVKAKLQELSGIQTDQQLLHHRLTMLDEGRTIGDIEILQPLRLSRVGDIQVFVKTFSPRMISMFINTSDTVKAVRARIAEREGIRDPNFLRLINSGKQLEDGRTIDSYNIRNDSIIHMMGRLLSCKRCPSHNDCELKQEEAKSRCSML